MGLFWAVGTTLLKQYTGFFFGIQGGDPITIKN